MKPAAGAALALVGLVIGVAAIYAIRFSRFVPSPITVRTAVAAAGLCAIGGIAFAIKTHRPGGSWWSWVASLVRVVGFGLLTFLLGYLAFSAGIPSWYTAAFGTASEQFVVIERWRGPSRWSCAGPDIEGATFLSTVCLNYKNQQIAPAGSWLLLRGPTTLFGINVKEAALP